MRERASVRLRMHMHVYLFIRESEAILFFSIALVQWYM